MEDIQQLQEFYRDKRKEFNDLDLALQQAQAQLVQLNTDEKEKARELTSAESKKAGAKTTIDRTELTEKITEITSAKKALANEFSNVSVKYADFLDPIKRISTLNDAFPILLFPLRLEIRFKSENGKPQLWLRVYPDSCNVCQKELLISKEELESAQTFWIAMWKAGSIEQEERGAWRMLVNSYGSGRATQIITQFKPLNQKPAKPDVTYKILVVTSALALNAARLEAARAYWAAVWIAKQKKTLIDAARATLNAAVGAETATAIVEQFVPENLADDPGDNMNAAKVMLEKIDLPSENEFITTQSSWTQAPKTAALPDRFVLITFNDGIAPKQTLFKMPVRHDLAVGLDPSLTGDDQTHKDKDTDDLVINDDLNWMIDFDQAVDAGMAIRVDLSKQEAKTGFKKIYVVGLRFSSGTIDNQNLVQDLFTDHYHAPDGFGLIKQGTPTNNTEEQASGYSWVDNSDESYDRIFKNINVALSSGSDGTKVAAALGLDPAIFQQFPNARGTDQFEASAMNSAMFPATLGYFMEEMMDPLFTDRDIHATRNFLAKYVSGRGPIPAIRVGRQPYGILPVTAFSRLRFYESGFPSDPQLGNARYPYLSKLYNLITKLDQTWDSLIARIPYIGKKEDGVEVDQHQILLDVVGLHPTSVEFHQRYIQSHRHFYNQHLLMNGHPFASESADLLREKARDLLEALGIDLREKNLPILQKYLLSEPSRLEGPWVDDVPSSEFNKIRAYTTDQLNYIGWLRTSDADKVRTHNFGGNAAPNALLYLLLRHAVMLEQARAATSLLTAKNIISNNKVFFDSDFINVQEHETGRSKFEHLFAPSPLVTGSQNQKMFEYLAQPEVLNSMIETSQLKQTLEALAKIENVPTARLERLLAEHLDCCHYRIDAWKTGLTQYKLAHQRRINQQKNATSKGLHLGAFGWLLDVKPEEKVLKDFKLPSAELEKIFNHDNKTLLKTDDTNLGYIHAPSLNHASTAAILYNAYRSNNNSSTSETAFAVNLDSERVRVAELYKDAMRNNQSLASVLGYTFEKGLHDKMLLGVETDRFIHRLRKVFPLVADNLTDTEVKPGDDPETLAVEFVQANNVVDGLQLMEHVQSATRKTYPYDIDEAFNMPEADDEQRFAIDQEVARLMDIHDALSDSVLAEQVYQVVQGNFERASANAEAFSKGAYPPETEVIRTPRSGVTLSHSVAVQFNASASPVTSPVGGITMTPRAEAEASVNEWLASIFPQPAKVLCKVKYSNPTINETETQVSQANLKLQPIDLLTTLNPDTEQAMAEFDERICQYVRYELSKHPNTYTNIEYTTPINPADPTEISFFELAALVRDVRKAIVGSEYLNPSLFYLKPTGQKVYSMDNADLKARIVKLRDDRLQPIIDDLTGLLDMDSIQGLTTALKSEIQPLISDAALLESILTLFGTDLKNNFAGVTAEEKQQMLQAFADSIAPAVDAATAETRKTAYEAKLNAYVAAMANFDKLAQDTITTLLDLARVNSAETGTGFIYQGISRVYDSVFSNLKKVVDRWKNKKTEYNKLMAAIAAAPAAEKITLWQRAERTVSSQSTFPLPATANAFRDIVEPKATAFNTLLANLDGLFKNASTTVMGFITAVEAIIVNISAHDVIALNEEEGTNNLKEEKLMLALLKEDIQVAINNALSAANKRIVSCNEKIAAADATVSPAETTKALLDGAKALLGEEALVVPRFTFDEVSGNEFERCYNARTTLFAVSGEDPDRLPVEDWLCGMARVRDKMYCLENAIFLTSAFTPAISVDLEPLQFPFEENDRWRGLKFIKDNEATESFGINNEKLLYTTHFAVPFQKAKPQCGILVDGWTEVIPSKEETTGVAFHYDRPNSEPPQVMLLAVPPEITGAWKWNDLLDTLDETLQIAKKRAVEPSMIDDTSFAQLLPASLLAVTLYGITVSTNLADNNNVYQQIIKH